MNLTNLQPAKGAIKKGKRIGRGQGSGHGGTSTRGNNGAGSRSGNSRKFAFEGGQMPIQRRLPKYGFNNINRVEYNPINISRLQELSEKFGITAFDPEVLRTRGLVSKSDMVKILGNGELKAAFTVKAHAFSASARAAIEAQSGTAEVIGRA